LFEITETSVSAVSPRVPEQGRKQVFAERSLHVSPAAPNVMKPRLFEEALPRLVQTEGGKRSMAAALVIPDYAVRMTILDFEELPTGDVERTELVRFRMRKSVPFPIEEAQVAYSIQMDTPQRMEVLAVAIARPILREYEALLSHAGFRVGLVVPSSVAALPLCHSSEPGLTLVAKAAGSTLSVLLVEQTRVRLVRCLDLAASGDEGVEELSPEEDLSVLPLLHQTFAYAEDQIGQPVKRLLLCGFGAETDSLGSLAQAEFGVPYALLRSRFGVVSEENAGLLGILEQYAA
jgi:type IV pilus assembly protein PilM